MSPILTTGGGAYSAAAAGGPVFLLSTITPQPTGAYSTRKLKSGITNAFIMSDDAGINQQDVGFDGSDDLNTTTIGTYYTTTGSGTRCNARGAYDQSGNARHFVGAGTNIAVFRQASLNSGAMQTMNGHPAVRMDSAGNKTTIESTLKPSNFITTTAFTIISSMRVGSFEATTGAADGHHFQDGLNGYIAVNGLASYSSTNLAHSYMFDSGNKTTSTSSVAINTNYVLVTRLTGGVMSLYVNGGSAVGTPVSVGAIGDLNYQNCMIGPGSAKIEGWWLDLLIYNTALSNADINTLCTASSVVNGNIASRAGVTWTNM